MRNLLSSALFMFICLQTFSQTEQKASLNLKADQWTYFNSISTVNIEYKFLACTPKIGYQKENLVLKFTNTSDELITISWHALIYYKGVCKTCDFPEEYTYELTLKPNEVFVGDCAENYDNRSVVFSRFLDERYTGGSQLSNFEFSDFKLISVK